ncbi:hypothetical protein MPLDJ20_230105 [Mesorhizobium plurifarium]|uniref:Uncharacterized protein n=1 Tax=Mesorhizobium plurifarium TaxID=69974 RepID=A0A090FAG8_MESPL|nr:hypothetical protein MPLDJ20_230105 [Mesorhizobium plurifarium]
MKLTGTPRQCQRQDLELSDVLEVPFHGSGIRKWEILEDLECLLRYSLLLPIANYQDKCGEVYQPRLLR